MYVICYGKSPKALETGAKLIEEIGGRYVTGTELITGSFVLADGESKLRWLQDIHTVFRKFGIGHALWNYKEKDFGFQDERFSEIRDRFIAIL